MNTELKLQKSTDLTSVEVILIEQIYLLLNKRERLIAEIVKNADDYNKVIEAAQELRYIDAYSGTLKQMKDQFFAHASVETLTKIVNQEKFTPIYTYSDPFIISKDILKDFRYGEEIKQDNPKAAIAKKMGAKIIV